MKTIIASLSIPLLMAGTPAIAAEEIILDYRDHSFLVGSPFYGAADRSRLGKVLKEANPDVAKEFGDDFALLGDAEGAFTGSSAAERIYLVQKKPAAALEPFPDDPAPALLVTRGGKAVGVYRLSKEIQYQRLVAAADGDGDGRDEVLLETSFMNMGQSVSSIHVVGLDANGTASVRQELADVYLDACDNPAGKRERMASTIAATGKGFVAHAFPDDCD